MFVLCQGFFFLSERFRNRNDLALNWGGGEEKTEREKRETKRERETDRE